MTIIFNQEKLESNVTLTLPRGHHEDVHYGDMMDYLRLYCALTPAPQSLPHTVTQTETQTFSPHTSRMVAN